MTHELKPEQVPGYDKLVTQKRHLLRYHMGTGKTVVCTKASYDITAKRILIICPSNAIRTWEDHICEWYDGLDKKTGRDTSFNIHRPRKNYNNTDYRKRVFSAFDREANVNVWITTAGSFLKDDEILLKHSPDLIIVDEAKRLGLTSRKSKLFLKLKPFLKDPSVYFWPVTGTPGHDVSDFWSILHLFNPKFYSSYWQFIDTFCYTQPNHWGGKEILGLKNKEGWYQILHAKSSYLSKEDMGHTPTQRQVVHVRMDKDQESMYNQFKKDQVALTPSGEIIISQTAMTTVLRYRQLLVCPKILDPTLSIGAAFEEAVETIKAGNPHTVFFTPFTDAMPYFKEYLHQQGFKHVYILSGAERLSPDALAERIAEFRNTRGIVICSILYATSFSLEPASECHFIGYEWDPDDNEQAEERINRLTTKHLCNAYYYCYDGTYDEQQCQIVNFKRKRANETLDLNAQK